MEDETRPEILIYKLDGTTRQRSKINVMNIHELDLFFSFLPYLSFLPSFQPYLLHPYIQNEHTYSSRRSVTAGLLVWDLLHCCKMLLNCRICTDCFISTTLTRVGSDRWKMYGARVHINTERFNTTSTRIRSNL